MRPVPSVSLLLSISIGLAGCLGSDFVEPPLTRAALAGDVHRVDELLHQGIDPNHYTRPGWGRALIAAASRRKNAAVVRQLIEAGADPNQLGTEGCLGCCRQVALAIAADADNVRILLASGAGLHPAAPACPISATGAIDRVQVLLQAGVDPDATSDTGVPPVFIAEETLPLLLKAGAHLSALDRGGNSAIGYGAPWCSPERLTWLREAGVPLTANRYGQNALHMAIQHGLAPQNPDVVSLLLSWGVPVNARDFAGRTPLAYLQEAPPEVSLKPWQTLILAFLDSEAEKRKRDQESRLARVRSLLQEAGATL